MSPAHSASNSTRSTPDTGEQARLQRERASDKWTPATIASVGKILIALVVGAFGTLVMGIRFVDQVKRLEERLQKTEVRLARMVEDGIMPTAIEQRIAIVPKIAADVSSLKSDVSEIKGILRNQHRSGANGPLSLIPKD